MLEIVLFLSGIGNEQETEKGVRTGQFWLTDATSSQHTGFDPYIPEHVTYAGGFRPLLLAQQKEGLFSVE
jgi:hypothetical protein